MRSCTLVLFVLFVGLSVGLAAGCGASIGDGCTSNVDCSRLGDRFCDTASPGGYCTVEGCDDGTCPDEATCIRFLTPRLDKPCVPSAAASACAADERCVCDMTLEDGVCQNDAGHCAPETSERRWCMKRCGADGDCRDGYQCRTTGTGGALPVPTRDNYRTGGDVPPPARFCAPTGDR
jgi:hypothetical protein